MFHNLLSMWVNFNSVRALMPFRRQELWQTVSLIMISRILLQTEKIFCAIWLKMNSMLNLTVPDSLKRCPLLAVLPGRGKSMVIRIWYDYKILSHRLNCVAVCFCSKRCRYSNIWSLLWTIPFSLHL